MRCFYFDVHEDELLAEDPDGLEFPNLAEAEREALEAAASIGKDRLPSGIGEIAVEVRDESRALLLTVTVSLTINRVHAPA